MKAEAPEGLSIQGDVSWTGLSGQSAPGTIVGDHRSDGTSRSGDTRAPDFTQQTTTFYWLDTGDSREIDVTATMSDGQRLTASAIFDVAGPQQVKITPAPIRGLPQAIISSDATFCDNLAPPCLTFGNGTHDAPIPGIDFTIDLSPGQNPGTGGIFQWVQVIDGDSYSTSVSNTTEFCDVRTVPALDATLPYNNENVNTQETNDSPSLSTILNIGRYVGQEADLISRTFEATMYLEWEPGEVANASANMQKYSVPVPLWSVNWSARTTAVRDVTKGEKPEEGWSFEPPAPSVTVNSSTAANLVAPYFGYPQWSALSRQSCHIL